MASTDYRRLLEMWQCIVCFTHFIGGFSIGPRRQWTPCSRSRCLPAGGMNEPVNKLPHGKVKGVNRPFLRMLPNVDGLSWVCGWALMGVWMCLSARTGGGGGWWDDAAPVMVCVVAWIHYRVASNPSS
eukprot:902352-Prorocentrum_minimum.AAC.2